MRSYKTWREATSAPITLPTMDDMANPNEETPTEEDNNFYHTHITGKIQQKLKWLVDELKTLAGKNWSFVKKAYVLQEVADALDLPASKFARIAANIKRGITREQQAQAKHEPISPHPEDGHQTDQAAQTNNLPTGPEPIRNI